MVLSSLERNAEIISAFPASPSPPPAARLYHLVRGGSMLQQFSYVHCGVRESLGSGLVARAQNAFRAVAGEMRLAIDFNNHGKEDDGTHVTDFAPTVDGKCFFAINGQGRIRNFN